MSFNNEQLAFARQYLNFDAAGFLAKQRIKSQLPDFMRRRDKTSDALNVLPPDHPQLGPLKALLDAAEDRAKRGELKQAYKDLEQVKNNAKTAAVAAKRGITSAVIKAQIDPLQAESLRMKNFFAGIGVRLKAQSQALIDEVGRLTAVSSAADRDIAFDLTRFNTREVGDLQADWSALETALQQDNAIWRQMLAGAPNWTLELDCIDHNISLLQSEKGESLDGNSAGSLATVIERVKDLALTADGSAQASAFADELRNRRLEFDAAVRTVMQMPDYKSEETFFTHPDGSPMTQTEQDEAKLELQERFGRLEAEERARLDRAKEAYLQAVEQDRVLGMTVSRDRPDPVSLTKFDTDSFVDTALNGLDMAQAAPNQVVQALSGPMTLHVQNLVQQNPDGDEVFDLGLKGPEQWRQDLAEQFGYGTDLTALSDAEAAQVNAAADEMRRIVLENYPNACRVVNSDRNDSDGNPIKEIDQVTVGGITYDDVVFLASGGGGTVYKCSDGTGNQLILKAPRGYNGQEDYIGAEEWDDIRSEAEMHRTASGGEERDCHQNILDMKGLVMSPSGSPLIAMDLADAGDATHHVGAVKAAESTGLISPQAAEAMNKEAFREMVRGMRAMQQNNMTHHDLKEANVFVMSDGTFKIADFGLTRQHDSRSAVGEDLPEFTPGMQAPEVSGAGDVTEKADNFTLGAMLENMTNMSRAVDAGAEAFYKPVKRGTTDEGGEAISASSLDRLRNSLLDSDPNKRPTLEAVLFTSYLSDTDENYTEEDITELRQATAEYTAKVGREVSRLTDKISGLEAAIQKLALAKTGQDALLAIDYQQRRLADAESSIAFFTQNLQNMPANHPEKRETTFKLQDAESNKAQAEAELIEAQNRLGEAKTQPEIDEIDTQINAKRTEINGLSADIKEINERPDVAPLAARMLKANAPFEARG